MEINKDSPFYDPEFHDRLEDTSMMSKYKDDIEKKHWLRYEGYVKDAIKKHDSLKQHSMLLMHLLDNRAYEGKKDKHNTWTDWYCERNLIVASIGQAKLCDDLGIPRIRLYRWTKKLEAANLIKIEKEWRENIYILGMVKDMVEIFFYEL
jgi:hypothetical protein